jgi:hypothetical protein
MNTTEVTVVRIYISEAEDLLEPILKFLHDEVKVSGVTVFRGISGFGSSGKMHTANILALSLDLPLAIEFFDEPKRVAEIMPQLTTLAKAAHIISWNANKQG